MPSMNQIPNWNLVQRAVASDSSDLLSTSTPLFSTGEAEKDEDGAGSSSQPTVQSTVQKQTSFDEEVAMRTMDDDENVFETDEEDVDESSIDNDDGEDCSEEDGTASDNDKNFFKRVDSRAHLTTSQSLLTTMIRDLEKTVATAASQSLPAPRQSRTLIGPSLASSPESDNHTLLMNTNANISQSGSKPIPIINSQPTYLSPRTIRRNMLYHELSASVHKSLLLERNRNTPKADVAKVRYRKFQKRHRIPLGGSIDTVADDYYSTNSTNHALGW